MKNLMARCIERDDCKELVLHEVTYEDENNKKVIVKVLASDPMDAIKQVQRNLS